MSLGSFRILQHWPLFKALPSKSKMCGHALCHALGLAFSHVVGSPFWDQLVGNVSGYSLLKGILHGAVP